MQVRFFLHALGVLTLSCGIGVSFAVMRVASVSAGADETLAQNQSNMFKILVYVMSGSMVLLGILALVSTAIFVHRVAGPLVPIERFLDGLTAGDCSVRVSLRKHDEFQVLAAKLNNLAAALESGAFRKLDTAAKDGLNASSNDSSNASAKNTSQAK
jgi:methyl-accepting chemotaxis protein